MCVSHGDTTSLSILCSIWPLRARLTIACPSNSSTLSPSCRCFAAGLPGTSMSTTFCGSSPTPTPEPHPVSLTVRTSTPSPPSAAWPPRAAWPRSCEVGAPRACTLPAAAAADPCHQSLPLVIFSHHPIMRSATDAVPASYWRLFAASIRTPCARLSCLNRVSASSFSASVPCAHRSGCHCFASRRKATEITSCVASLETPRISYASNAWP